MKAELITIGDEILIGQILDSNSQWIAQQLNTIGVSVYQVTSAQDEATHIIKVLDNDLKKVDIVLITGGLGPTKDDLTKITLTDYFNDVLIRNQKVEEHIKGIFLKMNFRFVESDLMQAMLPSKAQIIQNTIGTAAGMWFEKDGKVVVSMPGVPTEMKTMMRNGVLPKIKELYHLPYILHKTIITYGVREAEMAIKLEKFEERLPNNIKLAYLPNYRRLRLRLTAKGTEKELLEEKLNKVIKDLLGILDDVIYGMEDFLLEKEVGILLNKNNQTLATAESCTGGNIAHLLTLIPGSSNYYKGSVISYHVAIKKDELGVSEDLINKHSVVSAEVAEAMASGIRMKYQVDYAIATTGNAGPTTDKTDKSVGDVYIAIASPKGVYSEYFNFGQPREKVIARASSKALELLYKKIIKNSKN
jgi:nicotinamide-nucleotide amidase